VSAASHGEVALPDRLAPPPYKLTSCDADRRWRVGSPGGSVRRCPIRERERRPATRSQLGGSGSDRQGREGASTVTPDTRGAEDERDVGRLLEIGQDPGLVESSLEAAEAALAALSAPLFPEWAGAPSRLRGTPIHRP